ncbi:signal peptidase I [Colletotrichum karsti]|uniref:Signal peptidase complex catalytic subunit SEC11 n=1 Tax=Colletotrichum karsti TaxID=1095194 RepID=A0A9P6HWJ3_9PEZI|nr:signal peptidase I [Colletotrichum karsti]KAF9872783.1 signal peptidase I [Colletotrichum karsti]
MRTELASLLPLARLLGATFMSWKLLSLACNCPYPAMVVLSESMSPAFQRGDIIFLSNWEDQVEVGDIPVVWFTGNLLPMVHRAVATLYDDGGKQLILTKGDNNDETDEIMYPPGRTHVFREEIIGLVRGFVPYLGCITIAVREVPWLKPVLAVGLFMLSAFSAIA